MAYAAFSPENRLQNFLRDECCTTLFIATLANIRGLRGLSQSRLSAVIRGRGLEHDAAKGLSDLMAKLEQLRDALRPVPIRFHNAADINDLLNLLGSETFQAVLEHLKLIRNLVILNSGTEPTTIPSHNIGDGGEKLNPISECSNDRSSS